MYDRGNKAYVKRLAAAVNVVRCVVMRSGCSGVLRSVNCPARVHTSARGWTGPKPASSIRAGMVRSVMLTTCNTSVLPSSLRVAVTSSASRSPPKIRCNAARQVIRGRHLLGVKGRHAPDLAAGEKHLPLVPAIVVLPPRLQAVGGTIETHEVAVALRRVEDACVAEGALHIVAAAVFFEHAGSQPRAGRASAHQVLHAREQPVHVPAFAQVVAADVHVPERRLPVQLAHDAPRNWIVRLPPGGND